MICPLNFHWKVGAGKASEEQRIGPGTKLIKLIVYLEF